jgi:hypothetical protein
MRLSDQGNGEPFDPRVEQEWGAIATELRDERPSIDAEFAALLDERAAAGFPREGRAAGFVDRLRALPPRRLVAPAFAAATLLVVVGVAITAVGGIGGGSGESSSSINGAAVQSNPRGHGPARSAGGTAPARGEYQLNAPGAQTGRGAAYGRISPDAAVSLQSAGQFRKVAKNANLTLSTDPDKVRSVADGVVQVTRRYRGLVITSQITSGKPRHRGPTPIPERLPIGPSLGAEFQLRIPSAKLEQALDDLSKLGLVVSRTEGSQDITGRFNGTRQRIGNLTDERDALIRQLGTAVTTEAIATIKHRLAVVRRELARAQGRLDQLQQRVRMVPVHVAVVARGAGASSGGGGGFGIGTALHDAGRVLTVAPGGTVRVLTTSGKVLRRWSLGGGIDEARLHGRTLAVQRGASIALYDTGSGAKTATRPLAPNEGAEPRLLDVQGNVAVYATGGAVHVLRLSDGRDLALALPRAAPPFDAELTSSGLYVAWNRMHTPRYGRLTFVPLRALG